MIYLSIWFEIYYQVKNTWKGKFRIAPRTFYDVVRGFNQRSFVFLIMINVKLSYGVLLIDSRTSPAKILESFSRSRRSWRERSDYEPSKLW